MTGSACGVTPRCRRPPPAIGRRAEFPVELVAGLRALGIAGASIVGDGCPGLSFLAEGMIAAELARGDGSIATLNAVHSGLAMTTIAMLGSAEQRAQYLPRMATCEILGAFALTEPKHGSDVVALETRARRDGDEWVLTGRSGGSATAPSPTSWSSGPATTTVKVGAFVVEHPDGAEHPVPGYQARKIIGKAANRGVWQAQIRLDGVRVPAEPGWPRPVPGTTRTTCWPSHGRPSPGRPSATRSPPTRRHSTYSLRREQFGRPLARFQLIQDKLSHMLSDITGMQLMCTRMSQLQAAGQGVDRARRAGETEHR